MNFYGTAVGPQHTLYGRVVPMMEAMRQAICRAAEQPVPVEQASQDLPWWVHNIADELTCTVFKGVVHLAPATQRYHPRLNGQMVGILIRMGIFYWKEAQGIWAREGLNKLTADQQAKQEKITGWEQAFAATSKLAGRPITNKSQLRKFWQPRLGQFIIQTARTTGKLVGHILHQPVGDILEFLTGIPEGFKSF